MRTMAAILRELPTSTETGLAPEGVARSRERFGSNRLTPLPREPPWKKFLEKFEEPIIKILLAAALLSMFVDLFPGNPPAAGAALGVVALTLLVLLALRRGGLVPTALFVAAVAVFALGLIVPPHRASVEGLAIMVAVILATGVAFLSEYRSDREFEALNARKELLQAKLIRDGQFQTAPLEEVLVGDLVVLEMGDEVPADGRLVKAADLYVDESLMTGESAPVHKKAVPDDDADGVEHAGCLYRGTQVVDGVGRMIVTEVGDATCLGQIARRLAAEEEEEQHPNGAEEQRVKRKLTIVRQATPLQVKLKGLAELISRVGYAAALLIFLALLTRGVLKGQLFWPHDSAGLLKVAGELLNDFVYVVVVIVVAVPEGLPMSVTVSLALAMRRMTKENALVRQLAACETIGSATVICSDKTGTLTQNRMQVARVFLAGRDFAGTFDGERLFFSTLGVWPRPGSPLDWLVRNAAVNSTAELEERAGKLSAVGSSTEGALLQWLHAGAWFRTGAGTRPGDIDYRELRRRSPLLYTLHFSSERKRMTSVVRHADTLVSLVKGAPEWVVEHSTHYLIEDGAAKPWTQAAREAALAWVRDASAREMRTLAFAHVVLPPDTPAEEEALHARRDALERGLIFVGAVAIHDPLRPDVKAAVEECRQAGIEVKMLTGDNVETARAIAHDVGLIDRRDAAIDEPGGALLTSAAFNRLDEAELQRQVGGLRVLARARPLDKYRLVKALQAQHHVVAVTGDGTNDAPALKRADVGLAMGVAGTEVAKEASKIVLLDDAFSTIVKAVHWGRALYENIQRFLQFQLTINASALTIAFLGPFVGVKPPFTVLQLLWINVIMDTLASLALCSEPPRPGIMRQPPRRRDENILTPPMLWTIFTTAGFFVVVMLGLLVGMESFGWFAGPGPRSAEFPELTTRQVSLFFTVYVFFQVWNLINCRSLVPEVSGFTGLAGNPAFLSVAGLIVLMQVLLVSFGGHIFQVEPLGLFDWLAIAGSTGSVVAFAEVLRSIWPAVG
jgi:Ca2+-transporting ATPase